MNIKKWKQFNENLYDDNLLQKLKKTISCAEKYKNVYFWRPESNADGHRKTYTYDKKL